MRREDADAWREGGKNWNDTVEAYFKILFSFQLERSANSDIAATIRT
jgi:hypothetical protein